MVDDLKHQRSIWGWSGGRLSRSTNKVFIRFCENPVLVCIASNKLASKLIAIEISLMPMNIDTKLRVPAVRPSRVIVTLSPPHYSPLVGFHRSMTIARGKVRSRVRTGL